LPGSADARRVAEVGDDLELPTDGLDIGASVSERRRAAPEVV
jgi:hypothetical protein